jgi:hypothetical protein
MSLPNSQAAFATLDAVDEDVSYREHTIRVERDSVHTSVMNMTNYGVTHNPKDCQIAMLTAYFDESGIHKGDHLCVVAGFVGNEAQWLGYIAEWIEALKPRTQLHMKKLRWAQHPKAVAESLAKLGPIPWKHHLKPVFAGMWMRDYQATLEGQVRAKYTNPYMMCAQSVMGTVLREIAHRDDMVGFLFDRQDLHKATISALYDMLFKMVDVDERVGQVETIARPSSASKLARNVCHDVADFLAYQIHEYHANSKSERAKAGMSILGPRGMKGLYGEIYSLKRLQEAAETFKAAGMVPGGGQAKLTSELLEQIGQMKRRARS